MPKPNRRTCLATLAASLGFAGTKAQWLFAESPDRRSRSHDLTITGMRVTPIALPDPPLLAAGGCHGPYFLRNIIELETDAGITGIGETHGGASVTKRLEACREIVVGSSAFGYRKWAAEIGKVGVNIYAGIEVACLDAIGRALQCGVCELLGGPVRDRVDFASYLFYRYAADDAHVLNDPRLVDDRDKGDRALDQWGEVRTAEAMADLAWQFHQKFGFRVHKLKAGVLDPQVELETLRLMNDRFGGKHLLRIDPNGRWTVATALRMAKQLKQLPIEYYEDPVDGQTAMAEVRQKTGLPMSTNSCVTSFAHIPPAILTKPIDIVLADHHVWGGMTACVSLGTFAETLGWGVSQHSNNHAGVTMAAMIHLGATVPQMQFASDTHYVWLPDGRDILEGENLRIQNGQMALPAGHGLGVTIDQDKLARAHEVYQKSGMRNRDDANTMQRFQPGWKRTLF